MKECPIISCPRNLITLPIEPGKTVMPENTDINTGYCELSDEKFIDLKNEKSSWYMLPDRCTHKKFIERE